MGLVGRVGPACWEHGFHSRTNCQRAAHKYLSVTNHVYSPWIVTVSKKWCNETQARLGKLRGR